MTWDFSDPQNKDLDYVYMMKSGCILKERHAFAQSYIFTVTLETLLGKTCHDKLIKAVMYILVMISAAGEHDRITKY